MLPGYIDISIFSVFGVRVKAVLYWYSIVAWIIGWSEIKSDISKVIPYFESPYCVKIGLAYIVFVSVIASLKLAVIVPEGGLHVLQVLLPLILFQS